MEQSKPLNWEEIWKRVDRHLKEEKKTLESIIKHIKDVPRSPYNAPASEMPKLAYLRLRLADIVMGGELAELKQWYLGLVTVADGMTTYSKQEKETLKDYLKSTPGFELKGSGQLRFNVANRLLDNTLVAFSEWYNNLKSLVDT